MKTLNLIFVALLLSFSVACTSVKRQSSVSDVIELEGTHLQMDTAIYAFSLWNGYNDLLLLPKKKSKLAL